MAWMICSSFLRIPSRHVVLAWPLRGGRPLCTRKQLLLGDRDRQGLIWKTPSSRTFRMLERDALKILTSSTVPPLEPHGV